MLFSQDWFRSFWPAPIAVNQRERLRGSAGALLGIALTAWSSALLLGSATAIPWLIAPMGASAVLLFAVPTSPLAQPWSIIGGNLVSAVLGVACAATIADPMLAAAVAICLAIAAMFALRCTHPPSGAVALTAVLGGPAVHALGWEFVVLPVGLNSVLLLISALLYHAATGHCYPHAQRANRETKNSRFGFTTEDLDAVLRRRGELFDISRDDLASILHETELHAYGRRFKEIICADIMSPDVITAEFGTSLDDAWKLINRNAIKALPVIDRARRVIGIVTLADFFRHAGLHSHRGLDSRIRHLLTRADSTHSERAEVVGQIMSRHVRTAPHTQPIADLVYPFAQDGHHHIPIVNGERRLVGIVTQSDLIGALWERRREEPVAAEAV